MNSTGVRGCCNGIVLFTETQCLDLATLLVVSLAGPVGHGLGLHATPVPYFDCPIIRTRSKEGMVPTHFDSEQMPKLCVSHCLNMYICW